MEILCLLFGMLGRVIDVCLVLASQSLGLAFPVFRVKTLFVHGGAKLLCLLYDRLQHPRHILLKLLRRPAAAIALTEEASTVKFRIGRTPSSYHVPIR